MKSDVPAEMKSGHLRFRRFARSDVENLMMLYGDPAVMRYLDDERWTPHRIETEILPELMEEYRAHPRYWAAETLTGDFVGRAAFHPSGPSTRPTEIWSHGPADTADSASIGYRICRSYWRRGYATEIARTLLHWAFEELELREVFATTMAVNLGSRRVLEKAGLRFIRTVHLPWPNPLPGTEEGEAVYGLSRAGSQHDRR